MAKYQVGSVVQMKKPHACGANEWTVRRTGIDIRLVCAGCGQEIWLKRPAFEKRLRKIRTEDGRFLSPVNVPEAGGAADADSARIRQPGEPADGTVAKGKETKKASSSDRSLPEEAEPADKETDAD